MKNEKNQLLSKIYKNHSNMTPSNFLHDIINKPYAETIEKIKKKFVVTDENGVTKVSYIEVLNFDFKHDKNFIQFLKTLS